jgi:hypothetical protein
MSRDARSLHDRNVLPALRELLSHHPAMALDGSETLSQGLYDLRFLSYRPEPFAIEAALKALLVEGEALP